MSLPPPVDVAVGVGSGVGVEEGVGDGATVTVSPAADADVLTVSAPQLLSMRAATLIANVTFDLRTLNSTTRNSVKPKSQKLPKAKLHNMVNDVRRCLKRDQLRQKYDIRRIQSHFSIPGWGHLTGST